jgi:GxxExxY protein
MDINYVTGQVIDAAIKVHSVRGPGLLESAHEACLAYELRQRGLRVRTQVPLPLVYEGVRLDVGYRVDMIVEDSVIVENKAITKLPLVYETQLLSHLKLSGHKVGLLINFHVLRLKDGITRMVNNF